MFNRLRDYLSRMSEPVLHTTDGFHRTNRQYVRPQDTVALSAPQKRTTTVCQLFAKQHKSIDEITKLLDTTRGVVISALIEEGIILDGRRSERSEG